MIDTSKLKIIENWIVDASVKEIIQFDLSLKQFWVVKEDRMNNATLKKLLKTNPKIEELHLAN